MIDNPAALDQHFSRLEKLLRLESSAEAVLLLERGQRLSGAEAETLGTALVDLVIREQEPCLGGRLAITLTKAKASRPLPWNRLSPGSPVLLSGVLHQKTLSSRGVVQTRGESQIRIVVNQLADDSEEVAAWRLDLSSDEVSRDRQIDAMKRAAQAKGNALAHLRDVLLGQREPRFSEPKPQEISTSLNETQRAAIQFALTADDLAILHGPPGTGKTTAVIELVRLLVAREEKVLACAPSNLATDNLLERLLALGIPAVRLGNPIRVSAGLRERTLDALVADHDDVRLAQKLTKEAHALFRKAARYTRAKPEPGARGNMRQEAKRLLADARRLESEAVRHVIDTAPVLCATTTGLDRELLGSQIFDTVVIDEACQATEPACWPAVNFAKRLILAGDHCQLPPTVVSREAADGGLALSLMERLNQTYGTRVTRRLDVQYRMHETIMDFPSLELYEASLIADESVKGHRLHQIAEIAMEDRLNHPFELIDTAGAGYDEEEAGESRLSVREADLAVAKVRELLAASVLPAQIAVIAPYGAQVRMLREKLADLPGVEVDSVDGFQGREKEVIIISFVRSNAKGEIGFLQEIRRTNVAMTRARRKLILIGDSATLASHPFYSRLIEYAESVGGYRTVWEEPGAL